MSRTAKIMAVFTLLAVCSIGLADVLRVPYQYPNIQSAIDAAFDGDTVIVYPRTYTGPGNWDIDFLGKAITVRSKNGPSNCIIDCNEMIDYGDGYFEYYRHRGFYFFNNEDANSVLDGFTITHSRGAIRCFNSSPTITNCIISGNSAEEGGGICCEYESSPKIINCVISGNTAYWGGGGGIYCDCISPTITNCIISGNSAISWHGHGRGNGGGIYYETLEDLWLYEDYIINPKITSCVITGNMAGENGGGVYLQGYGGIKMTNCTITGNSAGDNGGGIWCENSSPAITNSIVWANADSSGQGQSAQLYEGRPKVWFSCIQDDNPDDANVPFSADNFNIDDDPCFVNPGSWDTNGLWVDGDYHLLPDSPCIETGDPYSTYHAGDVDMDAQPRLMGLCVDIGADEFELSAIVVTKPKGGEVWAAGSTHEIKWDSYNITGTIDIYYSDNNGTDWTMIDNTPDSGSFLWLLPQAVDSNQCIVAVEPNTPVPNLICIESELFTIQPYRSWPPMPSWPKGPSREFGPEQGCVKWKFQTDGPVTAGVTIGCNNRVHIPCEDGKLYTLNAGGNLLWTYDTSSPLVSSPAVGRNGNVYVGAENGKLYAIDRKGRLLWTHTTDGPIYSSPVLSSDSRIYVASLDGTLYALAQDGSELWSFQTNGISAITSGSIFASPAIDPNGNAYIAGVYDPNLYALDSNNGSAKWNLNFLDPCDTTSKRPWPFASTVVAEDGTIYQTLLYDPNLYAIDPNDGSVIWSTSLASLALYYSPYRYIIWYGTGDPPEYVKVDGQWHYVEHVYPYIYTSGWSKPVLAPDGTIYVSFGDPYLRAVDPDGTIKWVTRLGMIGGFTLTVGGDGLIYAACDDAHLYVVDPNGGQVAQFEGDGGLSFPTITVDRTIIVSDDKNTVWAISQNNCQDPALALHRPEDLNGDRTVNNIDFAVLAADWLDRTDTYWPKGFEEDQVYLEGDINKDLYVDFADLEQLANRWLSQE